MAKIFVRNAADSGKGSLRAAVKDARSGDTIKFSGSLAGKTIKLTSGDIDIKQNIVIDGSNVSNLSLSGNNRSRIFRVDRYKSATIKGLTFKDGREVVSGKKLGKGGAILVSDYGSLKVENSSFRNNVAEKGGAIEVGYGAKATVLGSLFDRNDGSVGGSGKSAGAIATSGSGVGNDRGFLTVKGSTFTNNKGTSGGAIYVLQGSFSIQNSVVKNNRANAGGAVFTDGGRVTIKNTKILNNRSQGPGGGLFLWTYGADSILIEDSLLKGNSSASNKGGGARVGPNGSFTLKNSTIADNTAFQQGGGLWIDSSKSVAISGATFSRNTAVKDVGGALTLNTKPGTPVRINHSTFVDNNSGRDAETIWLNSKNKDSIVLKNSVFAGKGSVNFTMKDGGGNFAENSVGGRRITAGAKYLKTLKLSQRKFVGNQLVYAPLPGSPVIKPGKDSGAFDVRGSSAATSIQALGVNPATPIQKAVPKTPNSLTDSKGVNSADKATTDKATTDKAITQTLLLMNPSEPTTLQASGNFLNGSTGAQNWGDGVTLTGYNADGTAGVVKFGWQGLAVGGDRYKQQIDYDAKTKRSEQLAIDFNGSVSNASVELGKMNLTEWGGLPETGLWSAYSINGDLVGRGKLDPRMATSTGGDSYLFNIQSGQTFDRLVIEATAYDNGKGTGELGNNSDFNLKNITYTRAGESSSPEIQPPVEPEIQPPVEPEIQPPVEPEIQPPVEPEIQPPVEPEIQPPVEPEIQPPVEPEIQPPVEPEVQPPASGKRISLTASASALSNVQNGSPLIQMWGDSVQISALDFDNSPLKVVYDEKFQDHGFGVAGTNDRWDQIDFYQNRGSEKVKLGFDTLVDNVTLTVGQMDAGEGSQGINGKFTNLDETGKWKAYDAKGKVVADGLLGPELSLLGNGKEAPGSYGEYPIAIDTSTPFAELVIEATGFGHGVGQPKINQRGENNSDFNVMAVSFDPLPNTNGSF